MGKPLGCLALVAVLAGAAAPGCLFGDEGDGCQTPVSGRAFRVSVVDGACFQRKDHDAYLRFDATLVVTNVGFERLWINAISMEVVEPSTCTVTRRFPYASGNLSLRTVMPGETVTGVLQGVSTEGDAPPPTERGVRLAPDRKAPLAVRVGLQDQRGGIYYVVSERVRCALEEPPP